MEMHAEVFGVMLNKRRAGDLIAALYHRRVCLMYEYPHQAFGP